MRKRTFDIGLLLVVVWAVTGCGWLWPRDNPWDPTACDPRCASDKACHEGACVARADGGTSDGGADAGDAAPDAGDDLGDAGDDMVTMDDMGDLGWLDGTTPSTCSVGWQATTYLGSTAPYPDLNAIWGPSATELYAVGDKGGVWTYDGTAWSAVMPAVPTAYQSKNLLGIWGSSTTDIVVVGESGTILAFDGTTWKDQSGKVSTSLNAVWIDASGKTRIAVGDQGVVLRHQTGAIWNDESPSSVTGDLYAVWGSSATDIHAAGPKCTLLHNTGSAWTTQTVTSCKVASIYGLWGSGPSDVYAVGQSSGSTSYPPAMLKFDGSAWKQVDTSQVNQQSAAFRSVFGAGKNDLYAVGDKGTVVHYNGYDLKTLPANGAGGLHGAWADATGELVAVGVRGAVMRYERSWKPMNVPITTGIAALWGAGPTEVFGVGGDKLLRYNGSTWKSEQIKAAGQIHAPSFRALQGFSSSDLVAVGIGMVTAGVIYRYNGSTWTDVTPSSCSDVRTVWGGGPSDLYAGGSSTGTGYILRDQGAGWKSMDTSVIQSPPSYIDGIFGFASTKVFAVGAGGLVLSWGYSGTSWSKETTPTTAYLNDVWGTSPSNVYAVGAKGTVVRRDSSVWKVVRSDSTAGGLNALWGSSATDLFVVGESGTVLRYDGSTWEVEVTGSRQHLTAVWGDKKGWVYAAGGNGTILRRCWK